MRYSTVLHLLLASAPLAIHARKSRRPAHSHQRPAGLGGTIDNAVQASILSAAAHLPEQGDYCLQNVANGRRLVYQPDGNHISPVDGTASPVSVTHYGKELSWIRLAVGDKNKCISSQWGGSYDHAAVAYECAVDAGGATKKGNTLEPTKQWWLLVPITVDLSLTTPSTSSAASDYHNAAQILASAQLESVQTREHAIAAGVSRNAFHPNGHSNSKRSSGSNSRKGRTNRKSAASKEKKERKLEAKKAARRARKAKMAAREKAGQTVKEVTQVRNQKYFVIPTDHLIDMHTMALTGESIATAGDAVSTALTLLDVTNESQMWYFNKC